MPAFIVKRPGKRVTVQARDCYEAIHNAIPSLGWGYHYVARRLHHKEVFKCLVAIPAWYNSDTGEYEEMC